MPENEQLPNEPTEIAAQISEPYIGLSVSVLPEMALFEGTVAVSTGLRDFENEKVSFSFISYEENKCELKEFEKRDAKEFTQTLKKASDLSSKELLGSNKGVKCTVVQNAGSYSSLFDNLPKDVELREIHYSNTGRVFGHMVENLFFITTVKKKHIKY